MRFVEDLMKKSLIKLKERVNEKLLGEGSMGLVLLLNYQNLK